MTNDITTEKWHNAWFASAGGTIQFQLKNELEDLLSTIVANDSKTNEAFTLPDKCPTYAATLSLNSNQRLDLYTATYGRS